MLVDAEGFFCVHMILHPKTMSMELIGWLRGRIGPYQPCDSSIGSVGYVLFLPTDAHKGGNLSCIGRGITGVSELHEVENIVYEFICIRESQIPC